MNLDELRVELAKYEDCFARIPVDSEDQDNEIARAIYAGLIKDVVEKIAAIEGEGAHEDPQDILFRKTEEKIIRDISELENFLTRIPLSSNKGDDRIVRHTFEQLLKGRRRILERLRASRRIQADE